MILQCLVVEAILVHLVLNTKLVNASGNASPDSHNGVRRCLLLNVSDSRVFPWLDGPGSSYKMNTLVVMVRAVPIGHAFISRQKR